jgi:hypothetical protein
MFQLRVKLMAPLRELQAQDVAPGIREWQRWPTVVEATGVDLKIPVYTQWLNWIAISFYR